MKKGTPIYGVGINDADYEVGKNINGKLVLCVYYSRWTSMLERCYKSKFIKSDCVVDEEWHRFMAFREWMMSQDWKGKCLDKDLLFPGNNVYSKKTCVFVPHQLNNLIKTHKNNSKYPTGVDLTASGFRATISINRKQKYLGHFDNPEEASKTYRKEKRLILLQEIEKYDDIRIKTGLLRHAEIYNLMDF
jgi:hypothetical protein